MRSVLRRLIDAAAHRIALATGNHLFRQPVFEMAQGVTVLATLDIRKRAQVVAGLQAGEFYCKHLYNARFFDHYVDHVATMARFACRLGDGLILEFGVATGRTLPAIANSIDRTVTGFDSFMGLPADWREGVKKGAFACLPPKLPQNA
jgi:hypothetical protein